MTNPITEFEAECKAAAVDPVEALTRGGLHRATWFRWKKTTSSPTYRNMSKAKAGLQALVDERQRAA